MVELIYFEIPDGADVENPTEDAVFMAQIGAKRRFTIYPAANDHYYKFELRNAKTGTRFTFFWLRGLDGGSSSWKLQKGKK